ncbi:MAG: rRNA pseudouridine synthase [Candidatus Jettenia sp.]|uniref:Pseudouridine synthase n=1 Tax=Candidatus Jettenia caeni TaxID=247490 RepID=I3IQN5_9BACT|nr:pseudouridine synthase [Candidatus Jettenia sp. AMX1]MBC6929925.1 rRNA pseudouridine synthase [Candidatus Jettenia sp.]NUN22981.1 rRNA pseudouridine synthase [Candidatus Jettenia caeni]KAA0248535.1 MAG: rRNA pseudouridine synthase [Candidatus Jettenia sp. AMX1]MCE7881858.1 rRNA pseudouridine synthase [Candidatus Jettenia sp. AMX1]MCQ3928187.1 rRNA pseudouridine synthase [Candidatus Jettenia sp.]
MLERLQKVLAEAGVGSRRECEKIITSGRVTVNGQPITTLGTSVNAEKDKIYCDGILVRKQPKIYYLLNKPKGYVCTNRDELDRLKAIDILNNITQRIYTVGRLDKESEGLIVLTNDGDFANKLSHPRYEVNKTYFVEVDGYLTDQAIKSLESGVWLSFGKTRPVRIKNVHKGKLRSRFEMMLKEGKNREIRRMLADHGYKVRILRRIKIGNLSDYNLKIGKYRKLTGREVAQLYAFAEREHTKGQSKDKDRGKYDTATKS